MPSRDLISRKIIKREDLGGFLVSKSNGTTSSHSDSSSVMSWSTLSILPRSKKDASDSGSPILTCLPSSLTSSHSDAIGATSVNEKSL